MRSGFVALIGKPNVGKSTLMNLVVGHKVGIVSDKAQTTRRRTLGIATTDEWQIAFVDTPGVHEPHTELGRILNEVAREALAGVDVVVAMGDLSHDPTADDRAIATMLRLAGWTKEDKGPRYILGLNKMDRLRPEHVLERVRRYEQLFGTDNSMLLSATKNQNVDKLLAMIVPQLPEGDLLFPPDEYTDLPARVLVAELIREKALRLTRQEVPHAVATVVDSWEDREDGVTHILASIVVEKPGQKAILIGRRGSMLKQIGSEARIEIEEMLGRRVFLELFVKVREDWRQNRRHLHEFEYF